MFFLIICTIKSHLVLTQFLLLIGLKDAFGIGSLLMCVSVIQHIYRIGLLMKLIIREWREEKK
nr:MAG TPA: hypothetical protein [Caudoviricetes sp.]